MSQFYCQECGLEVPLNANECPKCHKIFGSVLCPKCNYSGQSYRFENGCPKCGYLKRVERTKKSRFTLKIFILLFLVLLIVLIILLLNLS